MLQVYESMNLYSNFYFIKAAGVNTCRGLGIPINRASKDLYYSMLSMQLNLDKIRINPDFLPFTNRLHSIRGTLYSSCRTYIMDLMRLELLNIVKSKEGEITGKRNGMNDDLAMAIVYANYGFELINDKEHPTPCERSIIDSVDMHTYSEEKYGQDRYLQSLGKRRWAE